jgi:hypothetical protein
MSRKLLSVAAGPLSGEASIDGANIEVRLTGVADMRASSVLDDMLSKLHTEALKNQVKEVVVDIRELEFMNSACVLKFVSWLSKLDESTEKYKIRFLSSAKYHWQQRSLHALRAFAADCLTIETR